MARTQPEYVAGNVAFWQQEAEHYVLPAEQAWASEQAYWGIWEVPDNELGLLPGDLSGRDCVELGCGAGYVSAWMARRGGRVIGLDPTPAQLATATRLRDHYQLPIDFRVGIGEDTGLDDASIDFAISEYGAALWADPYSWVPEAARILRPGGTLTFLTNSPLAVLCMPATEAEGAVGDRLLRPYFDMHRIVWDDAPDETEFYLPHGKWIELFSDCGFQVKRLVEIRAPAYASTRYTYADPSWARQWPSEEAWVLIKLE